MRSTPRAPSGRSALPPRHGLQTVMVLAFLGLLQGCGGGASVELKGEFPTPLVAPMPVDVGLVLEAPLVEFVYEEDIETFGHWRVEAGTMQPALFRTVIGAMFQRMTEFDSPASATGVAGVIVPEIADFQISIPERTRSDFYEVWIKYVIRLYDSDGSLVVEWPLTAYGKASREDYGMLQSSKETGMEDATMTALRDAGAFLALRFAEVPEVKQWLARHAPGGEES